MNAAPLDQARAACLADPHLAAVLGGALDDISDVTLTQCEIAERDVRFATAMQRDPIQRRHRNGAFFEPEELDLIRQWLPTGGTLIDIGANVGNHTIFAGLFLEPARIIPVEPNPLAFRLFLLNVMINDLASLVMFDYIGVGASDVAKGGFGMTPREKNLGAARMVAGKGNIETLRPDDFLTNETPDFIKIDVEGMEMDVLRGLQKTIRRVRPVLLVEVDRENIHDFADWRLANGFALPASIKHYKDNRNFLCVPEERL